MDRVNDRRSSYPSGTGQVATELNPADGVKKLQEDLQTQAQEHEAKLEQKTQKRRSESSGRLGGIGLVTDVDHPLDPTLFKRGLELVDLGSDWQALIKHKEIFALENSNHVEKFQEGKRVMVQ